METRARLTFRTWGLPEPELNINIYDRHGQWLAKPDFVWRTRRVLAEYDGDQHRTDRSRWQYERTRRLALEAEGWTYVELTAESLADPEARTLLWRRLTVLLTR
jgi:very-short-patch-repair endonuclease